MFGRKRKILSRGDSVYLFAPSLDCADDFLDMTRDSADFHHPWVFPATEARRFRGYLDRIKGGNAAGFFIGRNADNALLGVVNINDIILGGLRTGSLGYYIGSRYARQGYMTEGLALVLDQAFEAMNLNRIEANVQPANVASLALISRLGFRKEGFSPSFLQIDGIWRDHERWAILASEWARLNAVPAGSRASVVV